MRIQKSVHTTHHKTILCQLRKKVFHFWRALTKYYTKLSLWSTQVFPHPPLSVLKTGQEDFHRQCLSDISKCLNIQGVLTFRHFVNRLNIQGVLTFLQSHILYATNYIFFYIWFLLNESYELFQNQFTNWLHTTRNLFPHIEI